MARSGSTIRKYRTALTFTETLSCEITSCGGTSSTRVRRSTRTICWTNGMSRIRPGPFTPVKRPRVKTTPRSYSRKILTALKRMMRARAIAGRRKTRVSAIVIFSLGFVGGRRPNRQSESLYPDDAHMAAGRQWARGDRIPIFSMDKNLAARPRPSFDFPLGTQHLFPASNDGTAMGHKRQTSNEKAKPETHRRDRGDDRPSDLEADRVRID